MIDLGAPIDVLWMRVSRQPSDPDQTFGRFHEGKILVTLNRDDYWQCAYVIPKGEFDIIKRKGLQVFRDDLAEVAPFLRERTAELKEWNGVKLLSVAVDRLESWSRLGLLCIGDSAHAMSPIGGVGVDIAIQDAVAEANILAGPLRQGNVAGGNTSQSAGTPRISNANDSAAPDSRSQARYRSGFGEACADSATTTAF